MPIDGPTRSDNTDPSGCRIVMIVANAFVHDTRVFKQAQSLIARGFAVTVIAMAKPGLPITEHTDGIDIRRIRLRRGRAITGLAASVFAWPSRTAVARTLSADPPLDHPVPENHAGIAVAAARLAGALAIAFAGAAWCVAFTIAALLAPLGRRPASIAGFLKRGIRSRLALLAFNHDAAVLAASLDPVAIESHDLTALPGGVLAARAVSCPLIYDSHELFLERNIGDQPRWPDKAWWGPIERICISKADAVLTVAEGIARHLEHKYGLDRVHVVRNAQPHEVPPAQRDLLRAEFALPPTERIALYPGAIVRHRGLEELIDAAPMLKGVTVVIMGYAQSDAYFAELESRADHNGTLGSTIRFKPAVPIADVLRWVASADLVVVPTQAICLSYRFEASNKMFHAVMAGVPLAMSDHEEKRILADRHGIGVLFDETDPAAIARAINDLAHDDEARLAYAHACEAAAPALSWEHDEQTLIGLVEGLVGSAPRAHTKAPEHAVESVADVAV